MANISEKYKKITKGSGEAPSGMHFAWHSPSTAEYAALTGSVPALIRVQDPAHGPTDQEMEKVRQFNMEIVRMCVDSPMIVGGGASGPEDEDWLSIDDLTQIDLNWLASNILLGVKMNGKAADTKRRAL